MTLSWIGRALARILDLAMEANGGKHAHDLTILVYLREDDAPYRQWLTDSPGVTYRFCRDEHAAAEWMPEADVLLGSISFPAHLLAHAQRLRWIQVTGAGVDRFLASGGLPDGVILTRADVAFGDQIAEYVIGHLLAVTQRIREVVTLQSSRRWKPLTLSWLKGRTLGVAGVGSIGRAVAARAAGLGMNTVGLARTSRAVPGIDSVYGPDRLREFLAELDVLALCVPRTSETEGMIGRAELDSMKETAILVNVARGAVVDQAALIDALRSGRLAHAILDVFETEPLAKDSPLWTMENVTVTSHHAGLNIPEHIAGFFLENLRRFRENLPLQGIVDPKRGY